MGLTTKRSALLAVASAALLLATAMHYDTMGVDAARSSFPAFGPEIPARYDVSAPSHVFDPQTAAFMSGRHTRGDQGLQAPLLDRAVDSAIAHVRKQTGLSDEELRVQNAYTSRHNGVTHVYMRQLVNGLEVVNANINVNVNREGKVISMGESVYRGTKDGHDLPDDPEIDGELEEEDTPEADEPARTDSQTDQRQSSSSSRFTVQNANDADDDNSLWSLFTSIFPKLRTDSPTRITISRSKVRKERLFRRSTVWGVDEGEDENEGFSDGGNILSPKNALLAFSKHIHQEVARPDLIKLMTSGSLRGPAVTMLTNVPYALSACPVRPAYLMVDNGRSLRLVWDIQTEMEDAWYNSHVDARTGKVLQLVDWVSDAVPQNSGLLRNMPENLGRSRAPPRNGKAPPAAYRVYPLGINDPNDGDRQLVRNPADENASPLGWHQVDAKHAYNETRGNNVVASENHDGEYGRWRNNYRPSGKPTEDGLLFDFPLSLKQQPSEYVDAAVTNLFYWNNALHDLYYQYGFNEEAGNFQNNNFDRGGGGGDGVIASAQDGSGYNNANFATPPDGGHGKMRMYVWNVVEPYRDGDMEGGIITHEYTHGLSIRLTGGPDNSGCLGWGESGGMGEGWGDFVATLFRMLPETKRETDFTMGEYANGGQGIRRFPYSTNSTTNPETYAWMNRAGYWGVHAKGAVWAEMLYELYWNLVDKHGFTSDLHSASPKHGNTLALQLVIDGMKLQPCRPSFSDARDAILLADRELTGGDNECEIWHAFAKRGLGVGARLVGGSPWGGGKCKESFQAPKRCGGDDWLHN